MPNILSFQPMRLMPSALNKKLLKDYQNYWKEPKKKRPH